MVEVQALICCSQYGHHVHPWNKMSNKRPFREADITPASEGSIPQELDCIICLFVCFKKENIYIYMPYVYNPESERKLLRIQLYKKEMVILDNSS